MKKMKCKKIKRKKIEQWISTCVIPPTDILIGVLQSKIFESANGDYHIYSFLVSGKVEYKAIFYGKLSPPSRTSKQVVITYSKQYNQKYGENILINKVTNFKKVKQDILDETKQAQKWREVV